MFGWCFIIYRGRFERDRRGVVRVFRCLKNYFYWKYVCGKVIDEVECGYCEVCKYGVGW